MFPPSSCCNGSLTGPLWEDPDTPDLSDPLPVELAPKLAQLSAALDAAVPAKQLDRNLLVATWNIRAFGGYTEKWRSEAGDSPRRDLFDLRCIGEIIDRFDIVAVQEARGNLAALRAVLRLLGSEWAFLITDVTKGAAGNDERMAFVFDTRRVRPSGLACELVVDIETEARVGAEALDRQFARTPYAASFRSGETPFVLVTLHVLYGEERERAKELGAIARWLAKWGERDEEWRQNLLALGDFNIDRVHSELENIFVSTGLHPADGLVGLPRTIFDSPDDAHYYDQIAWFADPRKGPALTLRCTGANYFDFVPLLQEAMTKTQLSWHVSDHFPLWVEFSTRPAGR